LQKIPPLENMIMKKDNIYLTGEDFAGGRLMRKFRVFSEDWQSYKDCDTLRAAEAYRYSRYGHAGYILLVDVETGEEIANYS